MARESSMNEATINANLNQCIKSATNFGETIYTNVCNGTIATVPWGTFDWFGVGLAGLGALALLWFIGFLVYDTL
jgi:uncharacterized membrane protein YukC